MVTRSRLCLVPVLKSLLVGVVSAQTVSPLQQVVASSSLISRPEVFRTLQASLENEYGNVKPGVRLDAFYAKMSVARKKILEQIDQLRIDRVRLTDNVLQIDLTFVNKGMVRIPLEYTSEGRTYQINRNLQGILNEIEIQLARHISELINEKLQSFPSKDAVLSGLVIALEGSGLATGMSLNDAPDGASGQLAKIISGSIVRGITGWLQANSPEVLLAKESPLDQIEGSIRSCVDELNMAAATVTAVIKRTVTEALDVAEHEVATVIGEFSKTLIAANAGMAVTQGQGGFAGGVLIAFRQGSRWQLGFYANGQLNQGDTTKPTQSLFGGQIRYAAEYYQHDFLVSSLFGDKQFKTFETFECGYALSGRVDKDMIIGANMFVLAAEKIRPIWILGILVKGTAQSSPAISVGAEGQGDRWRPLIQVSMPLIGK